MVQNENRFEVIVALILAMVVYGWGVLALDNVGFSVLNSLVLGLIVWKYRQTRKDRFVLILGALSLLLGWMVGIRAFELVKLLSIVTVFILNCLMVARSQETETEVAVSRVIKTTVETAGKSLTEILKAITSVRFKAKKSDIPVGKIVVGIVMGIPLVLLFGGLLYSADPIFAKLIESIKLPKIELNPGVIGRILLSGWFFGQVLALIRTKYASPLENKIELKQITETNIAVGMVEVLFLIFTVIQLQYWGVDGERLKEMGITYSDYTRKGYFQLIVTSLLAWIMVLGLDQSLQWQKRLKINQEKITKVLGGMILGHVVFFVIGATKRNLLYLGAYGFTRIRLLGMALSIWIVAVAILTLVKLIKNKGADFFGKGLVLITAVAILVLNIANIDRMIVKYKPASLPTGIDYFYLANLSDDAWEGWSEIVDSLQTKIDQGDVSQEEINEINSVVFAFKDRQEALNRQSTNFWQYGGGWNWASWKSLRELEQIRVEERLEKSLIKIKTQANLEMVMARSSQLAKYLTNMKRDWRVIYPYKSEIRDGYVEVQVAIEKAQELSGVEFNELVKIINQEGGGICQWIEGNWRAADGKYINIVSCKNGR